MLLDEARDLARDLHQPRDSTSLKDNNLDYLTF